MGSETLAFTALIVESSFRTMVRDNYRWSVWWPVASCWKRCGIRCICLNLKQATRVMTRRCDEAYASTELRSTQIPILFFLMPDGEMQMGLLADEMTVDKSTLPRNFWGVGIGLLHLEEYPGRHSEWCGDGILAGHAGGVAQDGRPARLKRLCRQKFGVRRSTRFSISLSSS